MSVATPPQDTDSTIVRPRKPTASGRLLLNRVNDWMRHHPGAQTSPSQQAFETITRNSHVPLS